ncbi:hypothetical protein ACQEVF_41300 [Nonomuraea polychroma]|uniref:hypothetical protein n=1 Tax=Nonomuraea polychroma TaxID=46176 RepID=UPI003D8E104E
MGPSTAQSSPADEPVAAHRVVLAGLVGIIVLFINFGFMLLVVALADETRCGHLGCIGLAVEAWGWGRWVAFVLAWPLLWLLRVRPAWRVALAAPFFLLPLWCSPRGRWAWRPC